MAKEIMTLGEIVRAEEGGMPIDDKLDAIMQKLIEVDISIAELRSTLVSTFNDEFSPKRKEMSNLLANKVRERLRGEFLAREMTAPSGNYWCKRCDAPHPSGFVCNG
jgi:type III secretory pathway component EscV